MIDRLVLRRGPGGQLLKAQVIDFKTDVAESAAVLRKSYKEQLTLYRKSAALALNLAPEEEPGETARKR